MKLSKVCQRNFALFHRMMRSNVILISLVLAVILLELQSVGGLWVPQEAGNKETRLPPPPAVHPEPQTDQVWNNVAETKTIYEHLKEAYSNSGGKQAKSTEDYKQNSRLNEPSKRGATLTDESTRWTNATITYVIKEQDFTQPWKIANIKLAAQYWSNNTCVKFIPTTLSSKYRLIIKNGTGGGCASKTGMHGPRQAVIIGNNCGEFGVLTHELGHAIGLIHEHKRPDRDKYITVLMENIKPEDRKHIEVNKKATPLTPYDYKSIMHYPKFAFSKDVKGGLLTLKTKDPSMQDVIGKASYPSFYDIKSVNLLYKCGARCPPNSSCKDPCFLNKECRCFCPGDEVKTRCFDVSFKCANYKQRGLCTKKSDEKYMYANCFKSCNINTCTPTNTGFSTGNDA